MIPCPSKCQKEPNPKCIISHANHGSFICHMLPIPPAGSPIPKARQVWWSLLSCLRVQLEMLWTVWAKRLKRKSLTECQLQAATEHPNHLGLSNCSTHKLARHLPPKTDSRRQKHLSYSDFILLLFSPHSWYKIRKAKQNHCIIRSGVLASEGRRLHIYTRQPIQFIPRHTFGSTEKDYRRAGDPTGARRFAYFPPDHEVVWGGGRPWL